MNKRNIFLMVLGALILGLVVACGGTTEPEAVAEPEQQSEESAEMLSPDAIAISLEEIGHWHIFAPKTLLFTVEDTATGEGVSGLDLSAMIVRAGSDRVTERSVSGEQIIDEGDGIYSLEYTPSAIGAYSLVGQVLKDGQHFTSAPVVFEVARDGEEGIQVDANGTSFVYQIRYNWDPGHIHANDSESVTLVFELLRGIETGDEVNWEQPWQNTFNHINSLENAVVQIESEDGSISDELQLAYAGRGIFEAERIFPADEVGEGMDYQVQLVFTDPDNGAEVTHSEAYPLHAVPGH